MATAVTLYIIIFFRNYDFVGLVIGIKTPAVVAKVTSKAHRRSVMIVHNIYLQFHYNEFQVIINSKFYEQLL